MSRRIVAFWVLLVLCLMAVGMPFILSTAMEQSERHITRYNESFSPTGDVTLNDSQISYAEYDSGVRVHNGSGTYIDPEGNYTWYQSNGTLTVETNSTLDNSSEGKVTYGYRAQTEDQRDWSLALVDVNRIWVLVPLILGVVLLIMFLLVLGEMA